MKKLTFILFILISLFSMTSCTKNVLAKKYGGTMIINLPKNERLVEATWKDGGSLWYLTEPMDSTYVPKTKYFREDSSFGVMEGTVVFHESR